MSPRKLAAIIPPLAALSAVCVSCSRPVHPFNPANLSATEKSCYNAISAAHTHEEAAISRKDVDGAMAECSPDFVGTEPGGKTSDYTQGRQALVNLFAVSSSNRETNEISDLQLTGSTAVVMVKNHVEATLPIPNPLTGQPMTRAQDHVDRETWVSGSSGWLLTRSDILSSS